MKPYVEPEKELITFTVDEVQYQAEEGMTWEEFVNSEYNTDNLIHINNDRDSDNCVYKKKYEGQAGATYFVFTADSNMVLKKDLIISNESYISLVGGSWG